MRLKSGLSYASFRNINFISTVMNYSVCYPVIINMYQICNMYVRVLSTNVDRLDLTRGREYNFLKLPY